MPGDRLWEDNLFLPLFKIENSVFRFVAAGQLQIILFEIDCAIFYSNLHESFCQFIGWTNWVNSGKSMDNCSISCQVMADMKKSLGWSNNY